MGSGDILGQFLNGLLPPSNIVRHAVGLFFAMHWRLFDEKIPATPSGGSRSNVQVNAGRLTAASQSGQSVRTQ